MSQLIPSLPQQHPGDPVGVEAGAAVTRRSRGPNQRVPHVALVSLVASLLFSVAAHGCERAPEHPAPGPTPAPAPIPDPAPDPDRDKDKSQDAVEKKVKLMWFGDHREINSGVRFSTPSSAYPGPVGVRLPEVETDPVVDPITGRSFKSTSNMLLRRAEATVQQSGAMKLHEGVAYMLSETTIVNQGTGTPTAFIYPIIIIVDQGIESGTVGTEWLCQTFERNGPNGTQRVVRIALIRAGSNGQGVWVRTAAEPTPRQITDNLHFIELTDGAYSIWPPQAIDLACTNPNDPQPKCAIGRVVLDAIDSAKAVGMVPESHAVP